MGSPISNTIAEIFLQHYENTYIKHLTKNISYYARYVDDVLIIYDNSRITHESTTQQINQIHKDIKFNPTHETGNTINFLDLQITRNAQKLEISVYRKPTTTDTTIHYTSNHPMEHKTAAYRYYLSRMHSLPLNPNEKQKEWNTIQTIAKNKGFPTNFIKWIKQQIQHNSNNKEHTNTEPHTIKIRTTFTYFSQLVRKITNLFKNTNLQITFKTTCTVQQLTQHTSHLNTTEQEKSGVYKLTRNACNLSYMGQTNRILQQRYKEHIRYIKNSYSDPQSAYALHILINRHEYGKLTDTMKLIKHITNPTMLLPYEQLFVQSYNHHGHLIAEQRTYDVNSLFQLILDMYDTSLTDRNKNQ